MGDYNGKTLSTIGSSSVLLDPEDVDGVAQIRSWYSQAGATQAGQPLSVQGKGGRVDRRITIETIKEEVCGTSFVFKSEHTTFFSIYYFFFCTV